MTRLVTRVASLVTLITLIALIALAASVALAADPPEPKFEHQTIDDISIGYGVVVGEVNGDGKPDILLADQKQFVWYENPGKPGVKWPKHVMVENLTSRDNVCIAARDINGDGKVEVAVGAMWNPGNTTDPEQSGSVHYLIRPEDPTQKWEPVKLYHEPTIHRMYWVKVGENKYQLAVLPLHGVGNKGGAGTPVNLLMYDVPADPHGEWKVAKVSTGAHMTHNMTVMPGRDAERIILAGHEGFLFVGLMDGQWIASRNTTSTPMQDRSPGEVRFVKMHQESQRVVGQFIASIEPMHGNAVAIYPLRFQVDASYWDRVVLDESLNQGHSIAVAEFLGTGQVQVLAGWRNPDANKKVGIKLYAPTNADYTEWKTYVIDDNQMATEYLDVADLDGDGKLDIVAAGRSTKNLKIYWNRTASSN
ncbi:MAG: hypothetical protein GC159_12170 [Phycisphaera sp.]|nr:hypothetical protein [Phycisphaera sp.]